MFGVGSMWTEESEDLKAYEGFDEAPYMNSFQGWPIGSRNCKWNCGVGRTTSGNH